MKKIILSILAISFIVTFSNAQENKDYRRQLMFGLKAGANSSNVYDAQGEAFIAKPKYGFAGGAFLSIPIGRYFGIQPEVLYSQKGFKATGTLLGSPYELTRTSSFIDVPLLIAVKPAHFFDITCRPTVFLFDKTKRCFLKLNFNDTTRASI